MAAGPVVVVGLVGGGSFCGDGGDFGGDGGGISKTYINIWWPP